MEESALKCSRCNMGGSPAAGWRKCKKCAALWCPNCAPVEDRCSNCIGGVLIPVQ